MSKSNERKSQFLGVPFGTACHKLRKSILFHLLVKLKENVCFKCGSIIDKIDELSIEHKLPWEGRDAKLFWDLENIAFSHLHCNTPHKTRRIYTPEEATRIRRERTAKYMRDRYTTERRRIKHQTTGY